MSTLRVELVELPQGVVVRLAGEGGFLATDVLQGRLTGLMARRPPLVVFDLAELVTVASLLMGVLVGFRRALERHGGAVRLAALQPLVLEAFQTARLHDLFGVSGTVEEALGLAPETRLA
jgi:anti-anti-sigma factor